MRTSGSRNTAAIVVPLSNCSLARRVLPHWHSTGLINLNAHDVTYWIIKIHKMYVVTNVLFTGVILSAKLHCFYRSPDNELSRLIMLYCEYFNISHTLGDRTSSSVIDIVLR